MAVDARDEISNVCYQSVATKSWVMWFKVDGVSYGTDSSVTNDNQSDDEENDISTDTNENDSLSREYLSQGSSGYEVQELQERLKELGYFNDNSTLYFGPVTEAALVEFQTDAGLTPDGVYNDATKSALLADNAPNKLVNAYESTDSEDELTIDNSNENVNIPTDDDSSNSDSDSDNESHANNTIQENENAVSAPETQLSDETDIQFDNEKKSLEMSSSNETVFAYGDVDDSVSNIQYILLKLGYYHSEMTGQYDEYTFHAVEFFQLDNSLPATGSVDEETLYTMFKAFNEKFAQPAAPAEETNSVEQTQAQEQPIIEKPEYEPSALAASSESESIDDIAEDTDTSEDNSTDVITADTTEKDTDSSTDSETPAETIDTDSEKTESLDEITSDIDDISSDSQKTTTTGRIVSGGTNIPTAASSNISDSQKSPKTGDPIIMGINSLTEYVNNYVNTTLIIILAVITCIGIFFAGTIHYWNVSMEKRKQRAKKEATVSVYRRGSM